MSDIAENLELFAYETRSKYLKSVQDSQEQLESIRKRIEEIKLREVCSLYTRDKLLDLYRLENHEKTVVKARIDEQCMEFLKTTFAGALLGALESHFSSQRTPFAPDGVCVRLCEDIGKEVTCKERGSMYDINLLTCLYKALTKLQMMNPVHRWDMMIEDLCKKIEERLISTGGQV